MNISMFDYNLPEELIAQSPLEKRDESRLLILESEKDEPKLDHFYSIIDEIDSNTVMVLNNTRVIPARIIGIKEETGAHIELLLNHEIEKDIYQCLARPQRRLKKGTIINFSDILKAEVLSLEDEGIVNVKFIYEGIFLDKLALVGEVPLPPYIKKKLSNGERYQTVYSKVPSSSAAPTAGLHFTKELLDKIKEKGVKILEVTLDVGLGTFRPVSAENVEDHNMHAETYTIKKEVADALNDAKASGKKILCVGTTSLRTIESNFRKYGCFKEEINASTKLYIYPPQKILSADQLITNFHLPKSTLLMLVSAFAGREKILSAYETAIKNKFRFFSFGDAMFIKYKI